jgi:hypothetical protein
LGGGTYDPDPLYVSVLSDLQNLTAPVPEPASVLVWGMIIGTIGFSRSRRGH